MGIFNWFGNNKQTNEAEKPTEATSPEVTEDVFIEKDRPNANGTDTSKEVIRQDNIHILYDFLGKDFQQQGYEDALINPDTSYMSQNIEAMLSDLELLIRRVNTFYNDTLEEFDFLIESRSRLGMVDTVDEIKMKRERAVRHLALVEEYKLELVGENRHKHRLTISYKRGFLNGMAAIAHHEAGKRKF
jgi:hypothetical protein